MKLRNESETRFNLVLVLRVTNFIYPNINLLG